MYSFIIIDDEEIIRKGILKKIETLGLSLNFVGEAENGREALKLIHIKNPDIILTDMRMPIMDGRSLLKTIQEEHPSKKVIVISGYNDFEYMKEAISANVIDYILKPFKHEAIFKAFEKAITQIQKEQSLQEKYIMAEEKVESVVYAEDIKKLYNFIINPYEENSPLELKSKKMTALYEADYFVILYLYSLNQLDNTLLLSQISTETYILNNHIFITNNHKHNMRLILLHFGDCPVKQVIKETKDAAEKIINFLQYQSGSKLYIGISDVKRDLSDLNHAYTESVSALDSLKLFDGPIANYDRDRIQHPKEFTWERMDELLFCIESGNTSKVVDLTSLYFDFLKQQPDINIITIKFNCRFLYNGVRNLLNIHFDITTSHSFSSCYEKTIINYFDLDSIKSYFLQLLSNISNNLKQKNIYPSGEIVNNIKKYVINNYSQPLTMEKVSSLFYMNRSYCSTLFNEKVGISFSDYVNKDRIERAKELLKNTEYPIFKIAKRIGYDNTKYFFRIFKKITGYTPDEYRQVQK